jgi:hypothetical protein
MPALMPSTMSPALAVSMGVNDDHCIELGADNRLAPRDDACRRSLTR